MPQSEPHTAGALSCFQVCLKAEGNFGGGCRAATTLWKSRKRQRVIGASASGPGPVSEALSRYFVGPINARCVKERETAPSLRHACPAALGVGSEMEPSLARILHPAGTQRAAVVLAGAPSCRNGREVSCLHGAAGDSLLWSYSCTRLTPGRCEVLCLVLYLKILAMTGMQEKMPLPLHSVEVLLL